MLTPFIAYVWLQTPSGANLCRSEKFGGLVAFACKEEWLRVDDASAEKWFAQVSQQLDQRLISHRTLGEVWNASFMPESRETAETEREAFEQNWTTTLHIERLGVVTRENPNTNTFSLEVRRYYDPKGAKSSLGYTADTISVEEDMLQVTLRFLDTRIVGTRPDRSVTAALDPANQARLEATENTKFYGDPSTAKAGKSIAKGKTVWVVCLQRAGDNQDESWGRTVAGWVQLASFRDASGDKRKLGNVYYCESNE